MHFWANDDARKLAEGVKAALAQINIATFKNVTESSTEKRSLGLPTRQLKEDDHVVDNALQNYKLLLEKAVQYAEFVTVFPNTQTSHQKSAPFIA